VLKKSFESIPVQYCRKTKP